jgi:hypothetical protein
VSRWTLAVDGQRRTMLIARLDRFSRRVSFIARIMDEGISLCCAEMPKASDALAEAKKRGRRLGANGAKLALINKQQADGFAGSIRAVVWSIGLEKSYSEIARTLNERGVRTRTGRLFYAQTVKNVAFRLRNQSGSPHAV